MQRPIIILGALAFTFVANGAQAAEFHVAPNGTPAGDGSAASPWDIVTAFAHPPEVMPGDTVWLHGGTYLIDGTLTGGLTGTDAAPIVVRQAIGERATLDTGASAQNRIGISGSYTWYWGFEIMSSAEDRWADDGNAADRGYSIDVNGPGEGIKLINLVVHDTQGAIGFWSGVTASEVYGCLIYYNGFDFTDRGHGHAIYTQNITGEKKLTDNILFGQYSHGIHAYTEGGQINDFVMEGNIGFDNGVISTVSGATRNLLIGGAPVAEDPIVRSNYMFFSPSFGGTSCDLGYGSGTSNAVVQDNVLVGDGTSFRLDAPTAMVTGNTFYGPVQGADATTFPNNDYYDATVPTGTEVTIRPNIYEPERAHVAVFNWDGLDEVELDPVIVLMPGDIYEIRDAQNYYGDPVATGTYTGQPIALPMNTTEASPVIGTPATPYVHTPPTFGAFVLLKTGVDPGAGAGGAGSGGTMGSGASASNGAGGSAADPGADEEAGCACRVGSRSTPSAWHAFAAAWLALILRGGGRRRLRRIDCRRAV
jgi:hypothetical protein